jgi:glycosyltransferase involved in cell wall biosynthesis
MKIAHIIDSAGLYGAEQVVLDLMETHAKKGIASILLSLGDSGIDEKEIEIEAGRRGLNVIPLRFANGPNVRGALDIVRAGLSASADIFHSHGYKADILLGYLPRAVRRLPMISTLHGWTSTQAFSKIRLYKWVQLRALKRIDAVVTVSRALSEHPSMKKLPIKAQYVPNGIPQLRFSSDVFQAQFPELVNKSSDLFSLISIGRLSLEKGYDLLLQACALLTDKINVRLVLVGEGNQRRNLEAFAVKLGISERVHFLGYHPNAYNLLPAFDVFVLSSHTEGIPISLLEAMQAGIPIVSTNVGDIGTVLDHGRCGRLIDKGDVESLAKALTEVHDNPHEFVVMTAAARQRALEDYGVYAMSNRYAEIYKWLKSKEY